MTDELELLLEEEEDREEQELPALFPVKYRAVWDRLPGEAPAASVPAENGRAMAFRAAERAGEQADERGEQRENRALLTETKPYIQTEKAADGLLTGGARSGIPSEEAQRSLSAEKTERPCSFETVEGEFRFPGRLREDPAGRFYRALLRSGRAAGYRRAEEGRSVRVVREQAAEAPAPDAAGLDRLFQRDARRYDGGFTWQ